MAFEGNLDEVKQGLAVQGVQLLRNMIKVDPLLYLYCRGIMSEYYAETDGIINREELNSSGKPVSKVDGRSGLTLNQVIYQRFPQLMEPLRQIRLSNFPCYVPSDTNHIQDYTFIV